MAAPPLNAWPDTGFFDPGRHRHAVQEGALAITGTSRRRSSASPEGPPSRLPFRACGAEALVRNRRSQSPVVRRSSPPGQPVVWVSTSRGEVRAAGSEGTGGSLAEGASRVDGGDRELSRKLDVELAQVVSERDL